MDFLFASISIVVAICAVLLYVRRERNSLPLPPGPMRLPLLGSVLLMPTSHEYLTYAKWKGRWGEFLFKPIHSSTFFFSLL